MLKKSEPIAVVDQAQLRAEYFSLSLVMALGENGVDRESLKEILKEARANLGDAQYTALQRDLSRFVLHGGI